MKHVLTERDVMAKTVSDNDWIVKLYYSFQDEKNLYLVMEFVSGGDMMGLLIKKDILSESLCF